MEILENIEIIDLCLYLRKEKVLVIGDIHIGLEEALQKQGFLIPRFDIQEVIKRLKSIFSKVEVKKIILMAPSSGTGDNTFLPVRRMPTTIIMMRKKPKMILVAATVLVRSSI